MQKLIILTAALALLGAGCASASKVTKTSSKSQIPDISVTAKRGAGCILVKENGEPLVSPTEVAEIFKERVGSRYDYFFAAGGGGISCRVDIIGFYTTNNGVRSILNMYVTSKQDFDGRKSSADQPATSLPGLGDDAYYVGGGQVYVKHKATYLYINSDTEGDPKSSAEFITAKLARVLIERLPSRPPPAQNLSRFGKYCESQLQFEDGAGYIFAAEPDSRIVSKEDLPASYRGAEYCGWRKEYVTAGGYLNVSVFYAIRNASPDAVLAYYQNELQTRGFTSITKGSYLRRPSINFSKKTSKISGKISIMEKSSKGEDWLFVEMKFKK